jgi:transposase
VKTGGQKKAERWCAKRAVARLHELIAALPPCVIGMEALPVTHQWAWGFFFILAHTAHGA